MDQLKFTIQPKKLDAAVFLHDHPKNIFFIKQLTQKKGRKKTLNACTLYIYTKRYIGFQSMKDKNPAQFIAKNVTFFHLL